MNIGDNVKFLIETDVDDPDFYMEHFELYHGRDRICDINIMFDHGRIRDLVYMYCLPVIENRTSVVNNYGYRHHIIFNIIIDNAELTDNGTYKVHAIRTDYSKCFLVYILGKLCCFSYFQLYPDISMNIFAFEKLISLCFQNL